MAKEIRQTLFCRTARPFQIIRGCLLCCEDVLGAVWKLFLLVAHFHLSNRHVCHKHGGVVQIQSRSLVPWLLSPFPKKCNEDRHLTCGCRLRQVGLEYAQRALLGCHVCSGESGIHSFSQSLLSFSFLCQSDRPCQAKRIQNGRSSLSFSLSACGQALTRPRSAFGFVPHFPFSSDLLSKSFSSSSNSSYISLRDGASFLVSCQCSAGCQYWTTMTRCSSFSLRFLLSFASWKSETDEDMRAKNDLNSVNVSSSELSSVMLKWYRLGRLESLCLFSRFEWQVLLCTFHSLRSPSTHFTQGFIVAIWQPFVVHWKEVLRIDVWGEGNVLTPLLSTNYSAVPNH